MLGMSESRITIEVPSGVELESLAQNLTLLVTEIEESIVRGDPADEEQLITDVWVGIVLTLLVLSCAACMCACMLYHRFQLWKRRVLEQRASGDSANVEAAERESLPSYTIVSGLPSYDEALQQLKVVKEKQQQKQAEDWTPHTPPTPMAKLSVTDLFQLYRVSGAVPNSQISTSVIAEHNAENKT